MIEPVISRDLLLLKRIDKPALLRQLFELGCSYSGQIVSFNKMLGQLQDAGNTTTIAHYLELLEKVNLLMGLKKYSGKAVRRRSSSPKFQVMNTALMTASQQIVDNSINLNPSTRGRLTESAIGAHLVNASIDGQLNVYYWRENNHEVDFVVQAGRHRMKSGRKRESFPGVAAFAAKFKPTRVMLVGEGGISIESFLSTPVEQSLH